MSDEHNPGLSSGGYIAGLLHKALKSAAFEADPSARKASHETLEKLMRTLNALVDGTVTVGARTPIQDTPIWATLEVTRGGFATGNLLANGPLCPHEREQLPRVVRPANTNERTALNLHWLSPLGLESLMQRLRDRTYRVELPEEGALLVVAWLVEQGHISQAREVLDAISPFFDRLRFYPIESEIPQSEQTLLSLQPLHKTRAALAAVRQRRTVTAMNLSLSTWLPLADEALVLVCDSVEGSLPAVVCDAQGAPMRKPSGAYVVEGGLPFALCDRAWTERAIDFLARVQATRKSHPPSKRYTSTRESFAVLHDAIEQQIRNQNIDSRASQRVRAMVASVIFKRGAPDTDTLRALRDTQHKIAKLPSNPALAKCLLTRIADLDDDAVLPEPALYSTALTQAEAEPLGVTEGKPIPHHLLRRLERSMLASLETLVAHKIVTSAETLATLLPQISAQVTSQAFGEAPLRVLYSAIYGAFRRRRSLLLTGYQQQAKLRELPWVTALEVAKSPSMAHHEAARQTLARFASLAIGSFSETLMPNPVVRELSELAKTANLALPLCHEIAADIFMGSFSSNYLAAAQCAARTLSGSLYARYYAIPYEQVLAIQLPPKEQYGPVTAFGALCHDLAKLPIDDRRSVARNGRVIEQAQILTTHNLAVLFDAFSLEKSHRTELPQWAESNLRWIFKRLAMKPHKHHDTLITRKVTAYAWRQMLFFLSHAEARRVSEFAGFSTELLARQPERIRTGFAPILRGLHRALEGHDPEDPEAKTPLAPGVRFVGWSVGPATWSL
ncbi:MAG: hypothetical protein Q8Q09_07870 [Deltaproteobacteria bacterium]|nr:hypothetical protein [Deltaproteobacteria bacterium]